MNVIRQSVKFPARARILFDLYLDPKSHGTVTGSPVIISRRHGSPFWAFDGMLSGRTLFVAPHHLIVQSWRSASFKKSDPDSLLIITLADNGKGSQLDLMHIGVPDHDLGGVRRGWPKYYWGPIKKFLASGGKTRRGKTKAAKPAKKKRAKKR